MVKLLNVFARKYKEPCNINQNSETMDRIISYINSELQHKDQASDIIITAEIVKKAVKSLNHKKGDGDKNYSSSHLIYASVK